MKINHGSMVFHFSDENRGLVSFGAEGVAEKARPDGGNLISLDCREYATPYFINSCGATPKNLTASGEIAEHENGFECRYSYERKLSVVSSVEYIDGLQLVRQRNTAKNEGEEVSTLTHISSARITGIDNFGKLKWNEKGKLKIHYCKARWCGEAHWYEKTPMEADLYPAADGNLGYHGAIQLCSKGSWTTSRYYPMIIVEDMECGVCYYLELENMADWTIELGYMGTRDGGKFYIEANGADYENTAWQHLLQPGETYETPSVVYGCVKGDFETALRETIRYKRKTNLAPWPQQVPYVCFNDYMNCLTGRATDKNSIPLIDAAAKAGAELYCMDAGWYAKPVGGDINGAWDRRIGTWIPNDALYGTYGLQGIINYR